MGPSTEPVAQRPEDLTRDGSLLKTVLVEGSGEAAGRGAKVAVRYLLRLSDEDDGEPFDSSAKRRDGVLEFTLGRKKVIPALELVAQSMKLGEKCKARAAAPYAFGARGLKRKGVPPNAVVFMEVEMVRCEGGEKRKALADMSPMERFEEAKKSKEVGNTFFKEQKYEKALTQYSQSIRFLSNIFYKLSSTLSDPVATPVSEKATETKRKTEDSTQETEKGEGFQEAEVIDQESNGQMAPQSTEGTQDEGDTGPQRASVLQQEGTTSFQKAVETSQEGQTSPLKSDAARKNKDEAVPEAIDVSTTTITAAAAEVKADEQGPEQGETAKPAGEETASGPSDQTAPTGEDGAPQSDDPEESEVRSLHVTTLNNLSLCFVKLEDYKRAVDSATLALRIDPESSKALYYRGRAKIALGEWEDARVDLEAANKIQPKNPGIRNELIKLDRKVKLFEEREKKRAAAMFA